MNRTEKKEERMGQEGGKKDRSLCIAQTDNKGPVLTRTKKQM